MRRRPESNDKQINRLTKFKLVGSVRYEPEKAKGVLHTAELSISCSKGDVGELYTIYYDPLDPDSVRSE